MKKECVFILTANAASLEELPALAPGERRVFVRPLYEVPAPSGWGAAPLLTPSDYLSSDDVAAIYLNIEERQRRFPTLRLADGSMTSQWSANIDTPPSIWIWLTALAPYWHICERLARLVECVVESEEPDACRIVGGHPEGEWAIPAIERMIETRWPQVERRGNWSAHARQPDVDPVNAAFATHLPFPVSSALDLPAVDVAALRAAPQVERARRDLARAVAAASDAISGAPNLHVILLTRGSRGAYWLRSQVKGEAALLDEYSEGMPDALVELCVTAGARLTLVYDGPAPVASAAEPLYANRYPHLVAELSANAIARVSSSMREAVGTRFKAAAAQLAEDPAFQSAFEFRGVNLFSLFRDYMVRSIGNLATLHMTQYEAWRVFMEETKPDLVIGGRLEAKPWISLTAHAVGAAVASIKLGIGEEMMPSMIAVDGDGAYAHAAYPDAFLVWGEEQARYLGSRVPEYHGAIIPVGRARSDTFVRESLLHDRKAVRALIGVPEQAQVIVYGANYRSRYGKWPDQKWGSVCFSRESYVACFETLLDVASQLDCGRVMVKPHPADDLEFITELVAERGHGLAVIAPPSTQLHNVEALAASDVLVSTVSSMFAEAACVGRPSINIWRRDVNMLYERDRWEKYNAIAVGVESFEAMSEATLRLLRNDNAYSAEVTRALSNMERYFGGIDGRNARRAALAAYELVMRRGGWWPNRPAASD
jgi:hypothetical protein